MPDRLLLILAVYTVMSLITFALYGRDKHAARTHRRRTPESTLHLLSLACGWPGALAAQLLFRHKTKKLPFQLLFWTTAAINTIALLFLLRR